MTFGITPRQRETLDFIARYIATHRASPSYDDIKAALGITSKSAVHGLVEGLVERGLLMKLDRSQRSLSLVVEPGCALPQHVHAKLILYCNDHGERFEDVLADAVELFLEQRVVDVARQHELDAEAAAVAGGG